MWIVRSHVKAQTLVAEAKVELARRQLEEAEVERIFAKAKRKAAAVTKAPAERTGKGAKMTRIVQGKRLGATGGSTG